MLQYKLADNKGNALVDSYCNLKCKKDLQKFYKIKRKYLQYYL